MTSLLTCESWTNMHLSVLCVCALCWRKPLLRMWISEYYVQPFVGVSVCVVCMCVCTCAWCVLCVVCFVCVVCARICVHTYLNTKYQLLFLITYTWYNLKHRNQKVSGKHRRPELRYLGCIFHQSSNLLHYIIAPVLAQSANELCEAGLGPPDGPVLQSCVGSFMVRCVPVGEGGDFPLTGIAQKLIDILPLASHLCCYKLQDVNTYSRDQRERHKIHACERRFYLRPLCFNELKKACLLLYVGGKHCTAFCKHLAQVAHPADELGTLLRISLPECGTRSSSNPDSKSPLKDVLEVKPKQRNHSAKNNWNQINQRLPDLKSSDFMKSRKR